MSIKILYLFFFINYTYLLIFLIKERFKQCKWYILELILANLTAVLAFYHNMDSLYFIILNTLIFILLVAVPPLLSHSITVAFTHSKIRKLTRYYAYLRYIITQTDDHKNEYLIFKIWGFFLKGKVQKTLSLIEEYYVKLSSGYGPMLEQLELLAHFRLKAYSKVIDIFESLPVELQNNIYVLSGAIQAYCHCNQIQNALELVPILNSCADKQLFPDEFYNIKICIYSYLGKIEEVKKMMVTPGQKHHSHDWLKITRANLNNTLRNSINESFFKERKWIQKEKQKGLWHSNYKLTYSLIIVNIIYFIIIEFYKHSHGLGVLINFGVNNFEFVVYQKEYWRLVTSLFLHFDILHLLMNIFGLFLIGSFIEKVYGPKKFIIIYFLSGLLSTLMSILWRAHTMTLSMGASGAICGLMGSYFFLLYSKRIPERLRKNQNFSMIFTIFAFLLIGYLFPQIDNIAHFSGLFGGFIISYFLEKEDLKVISLIKETSFTIIIFILLIAFSSQVSNIINRGYPKYISFFSWYKLKDNIQFSVPFSWKKEVNLNKNSNSYVYSKAKPFQLKKNNVVFWDFYNFGPNGALFSKFRINNFSKINYLTMEVHTILNWLRNDRKEPLNFTILNTQTFGTNKYWYYLKQFNLKDPDNHKMIAIYYMFPDKDNIYQFKFQTTLNQFKYYQNSLSKILKTVKIKI